MQLSDKFWEKLNLIFGIWTIGLVFGLVAFSASLEIKDLDLWLHLRMGQFISEHHFVPDYDVLSCSIAGKPWVNHEWLFQYIVYQIWQTWSFNGLINMQIGVVFLTFLLLLFLGYSKDRQLLTAGMLLLILFVYQLRFTIRPDIFSLLFFVSFIWILSWFINRSWSVWALLFIQVLWVNMHGFFFFGPFLVLVAIFSEFLKRRLPLPWQWNQTGRLTDEEYVRIKKLFLLLLLACCVNPLAVKGAIYPLGILFGMGTGSSKIFFNHITELHKPITEATIWTFQNSHYKTMIVVSALSLIFNRRQIDISTVFVWGIFLVFSLAAIRNEVFFMVAAYMVIVANAQTIVWQSIIPIEFVQKRFKFITGIVVKILLMFWMLDYATTIATNGYFDFDTFERKSEYWDVSKRSFPYQAVDFLANNQIKGNFFNDFNSGAYLLGRCSPNIKVYIDGRTEEYGGSFFEHYLKIWHEGDSKIFLAEVEKYHLTGAFLNNNNQRIPEKTLKMFYQLPDWKIIYFDYDAVIFLKNIPLNKPWIDRFTIDLKKWQPKPFDLQRLGTKVINPIPLRYRAYLLKTLGFNEAAMKEAQEILKIAPDEFDAFKILGEVYERKGDYLKAFENLRIAAILNSGDIRIRIKLAEACEHLKNYKCALIQYGKILDIEPKNSKVFFGMARVYALQGQFPKAREYLNKAQLLDPKDKIDVKKIHDIMNQNKKNVNPTQTIITNKKK